MNLKKTLVFTFLFTSIFCFGQKWDTEEYIKKYNYQEVIGYIEKIEPDRKPDIYAMYPDGKQGIYSLISEKIKIPNKAVKNKISGTVILRYIVGKDGYVTDITVVKSVSKSLDKAAIKVLKKMKRWIPAKVNGKNVRGEYRQPFRFDL